LEQSRWHIATKSPRRAKSRNSSAGRTSRHARKCNATSRESRALAASVTSAQQSYASVRSNATASEAFRSKSTSPGFRHMVVFPVAIHTASFGADHVSFGVARPPRLAMAARIASSTSGNDRIFFFDAFDASSSSSSSVSSSSPLSLWPYFALSAANESAAEDTETFSFSFSLAPRAVAVAVASSSLSSSSVNALSSRSSS